MSVFEISATSSKQKHDITNIMGPKHNNNQPVLMIYKTTNHSYYCGQMMNEHLPKVIFSLLCNL